MKGSSSSGELKAPVFDEDNYDFWRIRMTTIFKSYDLRAMVQHGYELHKMEVDVLEEDLTKTQLKTLKQNWMEDAKALGIIQVSVIEETKDIETLSLQDMMASLRAFDQRLERHLDSTIEKAFQSLSVGSCSQANASKQKPQWKGKNKKWEGKCNHMTAYESLLSDLNINFTGKVKMGDGNIVKATGRGTVVINTKKGRKCIREVILVFGLDENLLSVGQMMEHGYFLLFGETMVEIYDDRSLSNLVTRLEVKNRNFPLMLKYLEEVARKASVIGFMKLWHKRLGHLNMTSLENLQKHEMVQRIPKMDQCSETCEGCVFGKHHRDPFEAGKAWRAIKPLELIHTDMCGLMQTTTISRNKYFLTFIYDYSQMCWVYFIRFKSEVFTIFKKFKEMVELQSGYQIKRLRSDIGGEYTSYEFNAFCEDVGLEKQLTVVYSPQQNEIAEMKNRTIVEMAKSMLNEKNMPYTFWGEAVNTSVCLLNRCPTKALDKKTPFEVLSGRKPSVKHLRVFGSVCYTYIPQQLRHKLEKSSNNGVFVCYGTNEKGYRVYNLST
ncbi:unnamed protein product [Malus baccata var. baccata]